VGGRAPRVALSRAGGGGPAPSPGRIATGGGSRAARVMGGERPSRSPAGPPPAGTWLASAARMISEPSRRISSCKSPTALCSLSSERNEFEQTSSASAALLWAAVVRNGRISWSTTGTPRAAICQAASDPASPPPTTCTARRRSSVMERDYLVPFLVLQIGRAKRGTNNCEREPQGAKAKAPAGGGRFHRRFRNLRGERRPTRSAGCPI